LVKVKVYFNESEELAADMEFEHAEPAVSNPLARCDIGAVE